MTGTYRRGGRVRRDYFSRLRPSVFVARGGRCREIGLKWFVQALFRYGDNGEPVLGEVPIKAERSMDGLIPRDHRRCRIYRRVRLVASTAKEIKSCVKLVCCWMEHANLAVTHDLVEFAPINLHLFAMNSLWLSGIPGGSGLLSAGGASLQYFAAVRGSIPSSSPIWV